MTSDGKKNDPAGRGVSDSWADIADDLDSAMERSRNAAHGTTDLAPGSRERAILERVGDLERYLGGEVAALLLAVTLSPTQPPQEVVQAFVEAARALRDTYAEENDDAQKDS